MFDNKTVAFVATGGGGRSLAHIGVIQACKDLGIKFDLMIGASSGALATIFYSQYEDTDMVLDYFRPKKKKKYGLRSFNWGVMMSFKNLFSKEISNGIFDLSAAERFFRTNLPIDKFDKLPIPTYITATNLDTREGVLFGPDVHNDVPVSRALVASCCIPLLFRPIEINGNYYIDGEIRSPASTIEAVIQLGADIIIVSDVYGGSSGNIAKSGMFNIASEVINMVLEDKSLRGVRTYKNKYPSKKIITIEPELSKVSAFSTKHYETSYESGYKAAMGALGEQLNGYGIIK